MVDSVVCRVACSTWRLDPLRVRFGASKPDVRINKNVRFRVSPALYIMEMTDQQKLLVEYVERGSEEAFRDLVASYLTLVYSSALRLTGGNRPLAEDVTQTVFADLARLAGTLPAGVMLGGWLHRRTWHVAAAVMRSERRRQQREREAAEMNAMQDHSEESFRQIAPVLDEAVNQLGEEDRAAITMRFLEGRDFQSVGEALGSNADAARKRVVRALDKLRESLLRKGVATPGAALAAVLTAHAITAPPAGMAASISSAALANAASTGAVGVTLMKFLAMGKIKLAVSAVVVAGLGTALVLEHQAVSRMQDRNRAVEARLGGFDAIAQENNRLSNLLTKSSSGSVLPQEQFRELLKLRGEVGMGRRLQAENPKLRNENSKLRSASRVVNAPPSAEPQDPEEQEFQKATELRMGNLKQWSLMFILAANKQNDEVPAGWEQVADQIDPGHRASFLEFATNTFEIVYQGKLPEKNAGEILLFKEKEARRSPTGDWVKVYGYADGHSEAHSEPDGNFETWERQHQVAPSGL